MIQKRTSPFLTSWAGRSGTATDDAIERSNDAGLVKLELRGSRDRPDGDSVGAVARNFGDDFIELVFDVLPVFFAKDFVVAHLVGAAKVGFVHLLFGLPFGDLGLSEARCAVWLSTAARRARSSSDARICPCRTWSPISTLIADYAAVAFACNIGLLLCNQRASGDVRMPVCRGHFAGRGGRHRSRRRRTARSAQLPPGPSVDDCNQARRARAHMPSLASRLLVRARSSSTITNRSSSTEFAISRARGGAAVRNRQVDSR